MLYRLLADGVVLSHFLFVLFVILGGLLVLRWPRLAWLHVPAAIWGAVVMFTGWICPLTPLEWHLRELGGQAGYDGGFIEEYIFGLLYPAGLTRLHQILLGGGVAILAGAIYGRLLYRACRSAPGRPAHLREYISTSTATPRNTTCGSQETRSGGSVSV